jgi:hypothetical protein
MRIIRPVRAAVAILALASLALPASAGHQRNAFRVGAVVVRSGGIETGPSRVSLAAKAPVLVSIDGASPRLVRGQVALPPGTSRVTIQY